MENPFDNPIKKESNYTTTRIEKRILDKLKSLGRGSPNQAIDYLLGNSADEKLITRVKEIENELTKLTELTEAIERIVALNRLRYA